MLLLLISTGQLKSHSNYQRGEPRLKRIATRVTVYSQRRIRKLEDRPVYIRQNERRAAKVLSSLYYSNTAPRQHQSMTKSACDEFGIMLSVVFGALILS